MVMSYTYSQYATACKSIKEGACWTEQGWAGLADTVRVQIMQNLLDRGAWWPDLAQNEADRPESQEAAW